MGRRIEQIFSERAAQWKDRIAIEAEDRRTSYRDLDERSDRLARRLIAANVVRNDIVAVGTGNIEHFAVAMLAILKAQAAYLPIDTRYPVERIRYILSEALPRVVLADSDLPARLIPEGLPTISNFAQDDADRTEYRDLPSRVVGSADDTACIFYTSGSSGRPKGIEVAHRGIPNLLSDTALLPFGPNDRIGQATNFAFDVINFELWGALLNGGCIVRIRKSELFSAAAMRAFLESKRITVLMLTTSLFNALAAGDPTTFRSLQALVIAGEAADPHSIARVFHSGQPPRFINAYGPTEATTFASWHEITADDVVLGRIPIGKAVKGMSLYLLDNAMKPVPLGETGELFIGGPGVAKGYRGQTALTEAAFVANPFGSESAPRLYRTGDLCRELPDGSLEYIGRIDDQVKIRGFRVELSEVASILRGLPGVKDAAVLARTTSFNARELVAFVRGESLPPPKELRATLARLVPDYMLPSIIQPVEAFPPTANGKLDRAALLTNLPSQTQSASLRNQISEIEKQLAEIWKSVLRRGDIGSDSDFYELGGDSLSLMNLALEIETNLGVSCHLDDWIACRTRLGGPLLAAVPGSISIYRLAILLLRRGQASTTWHLILNARFILGNRRDLTYFMVIVLPVCSPTRSHSALYQQATWSPPLLWWTVIRQC